MADDRLGYCHCGCGQRTAIAKRDDARYGSRAGEPRRYLKGHHRRGSRLTYVIQDAGHTSACWVWQGALCQGYGHLNTREHKGPAHIYFYVQRFGPVPDGHELHHRCENRACVNPEHLEPLTDAAHRRLRRDNKLNPGRAEEIKLMARQGMTQRSIAAQFGIAQATAWAVINGQIWDG